MDKHLLIVEDLKNNAIENTDVEGLILFGSVMRNEHTENSDIDLFFIYKELDFNMSVFRQTIDGILIQGYKIKHSYLIHLIFSKEHFILENFANGNLIVNKNDELYFLQNVAQKRFFKQNHSPDDWFIQTKRDYYSVILYNLKKQIDNAEFVQKILRLLTVNLLQHHIRINHIWQIKRSHRICKITEENNSLYEILDEFYSNAGIENKIICFEKMIKFVFHKYGGLINNNWGMRTYEQPISIKGKKKTYQSSLISKSLKSRTSVVNIDEL